jgi:plasmid segregation protein ParM
MVYGIDNGYHYTKDSDKHIFKSAIQRTDNSLTGDNQIIINGVNYYFGKGDTTADIDKIDSTINRVCTLASLAMKGSGDYNLVVGLPIGQYHSKKDKFKQSIMDYNHHEIMYNNKWLDIRILDVTVFAQGAGVLFRYPIPDGEYIIVDVGSYTVNVVLVDLVDGIPHIIKYDTWYKGILILYGDIINAVNQRYDLTLDMMDAEKIIKQGLNVNSTRVDVKFLDNVKEEYLSSIFTKFKLRYSYATTPIIICGGGGALMQSMIEEEFNNSILMPDAQFANAIGYYNFGLQKYGGR